MSYSHIEIEVSGTKYPLNIDLPTYTEVDVTDFAPRVVSGTPHLSEQGIYLDIGQDDWRHGMGFPFFRDPKGYMYSGSGVDTRHGFIQMGTELQNYPVVGTEVPAMINHNGHQIICTGFGLWTILDGVTDTTRTISTITDFVDLLSVGRYFYAAQETGRMRIGDIRPVASVSGGGTITTVEGANWDDDIFNGGTIKIIDGTGLGQSKVITDTSDGDKITHAAWSTNPDATSTIAVLDFAGNDANPPMNFIKFCAFGGYFWAIEKDTNYLHYWAETDATDAEGGGLLDAKTVQVGPPGLTPHNMISFDNQLWVFRPDGGWVIGEDNLAYHTLAFADQIHENNFASVVVWNGFLIFPIRNTLYKFKSGLQDITPPLWDREFPHKQFGRFRGLVARGKFLYVLAKPNAQFAWEDYEASYKVPALLCFDGVGWHKLTSLATVVPVGHTTYYNAWLDPYRDTINIVWNLGSTIYSGLYQLQTESDLPYPYFDTNWVPAHDWYSSWFDLGLGRINKSFASFTVGGYFPSGCSVEVHYRIDDDASFTELGTVTSDMTELDFPTGKIGKRIQFKLNLLTTDSSLSPVVEKIILKCMLRPDVVYGISCDILISDDLSNHTRKQLGMTAKEIRAALKAARDSVSPITLTDIHGDSAAAYLASLRFMVIAYEGMDAVQEVARVTFTYV